MGFTTNPIITGIEETFPVIGTSKNYNKVGGWQGPALALNFLGDSLPNGVTFSRVSNATQFDSLGRLVWAPANMSPNASNSGAVSGIIGSGGALPTAWTIGSGSVTTLTTQIVGTGTETGLPYVDIRVFGTANVAGSVSLDFSAAAANPASTGQIYTVSAYVVRVAGNAIASAFGIRVVDANPGFLADSPTNFVPGTGLLSSGRQINTRTLGAGSTFVRHSVYFGVLLNEVIDITIRVGGIILERTGVDSPKVWNPSFATTGTAYYGPRFDYNPQTLAPRGLLIEETRTNAILNSALVGGVGGTPGTPATSWSLTGATGVTITTAYGTEDGIPYIDVTYSGTNTTGAQAFPTVFLGLLSAGTTASNGQTFTGSCYVRKIAGADAISSHVINVRGRAAGVLVPGQSAAVALSSAANLAISRNTTTFTFTDPTITTTELIINRTLAIAEAIDITIRIGGSQLELGAFATSLIPTFGTAATRAGDVATVASVGWASASSAATMFVDIRSIGARAAAGSIGFIQLDNGTSANRIALRASALLGDNQATWVVGGTVNSNLTYSPSGFVARKVAMSWDATNFKVAANNAIIAASAAHGGVPAVTQMSIAGVGGIGSIVLNGHVASIAGYSLPTIMTDSQLQALTT